MSTDAELAAVLDRAVTGLVSASAPPPVETVLLSAARRGRHRAAAALAGAVAALAVVATVAVNGVPSRGGHGAVAQAPAESPRMLPLSRGTARIIEAQSRLRHLALPPAVAGRVLASTTTAKGEVVLLDVQVPNGLRCVLEQYAVADTPGGGGGRCANGPQALPYTGGGVDLSAGQETTPGGTNVSVVYGSAPPGTTRVELRGDGARLVVRPATDAGDAYDHRAFFIGEWPDPTPVTVVALDADGAETGKRSQSFGPSQSPAQPRYLPPGVAVLSGPDAAPGQGQDVGRTAYSVAHEAGQDGPGWTLELLSRPGVRVEVLPPDAASSTEVLERSGVTYYLTRPRTGFGTYRLDWTDGRFVYSLIGDRLNLPGGPSGIPLDELQRMAFSIA